MHSIDLADLAGTFVRYVPAQIALQCTPSRDSVQDYWLTCRYRHESWMKQLSEHREAIARPGTSFRSRCWHGILPVMQEILLSEPLIRVLAYYATVLWELKIDDEFSPLANSSLAAQIEARNRCLNLIVFGTGLSVENAVKLNRLRRTMESYTDQLLSTMRPVSNIGSFAFDSQRIAEAQAQLGSIGRQSNWVALHAVSLCEALWRSTGNAVDWRAANARLNYRLSQAVLKLIPPTLFDGLGVPYQCQLARFIKESPESRAEINGLARPDSSPNELTSESQYAKLRRLNKS